MASTSKVIIVTGASRGIGLAIAQYLLKMKHQVYLAARSEGQLKALKAQYPEQVEYSVGDLTEARGASTITNSAIKKFGRIDGMVINHGALAPITRLADASVEDWKKLYDVNVFSGVALIQAAIPELRKTKGCVVWISSGAATSAYSAWGAYGSSKAAMHIIAATLAKEEAEISSICISPGRVDTDMQRVLREEGKDAMDAEDHAGFVTAFESGELSKPERPASVIGRLVVNPKLSLSGKVFKLNAPELADYHD